MNKLIHKYQGFSITEILVTMVIGLVLMTGIINIFIGSKRTYKMNDELVHFQENGRYIVERMGIELRMAGHAACVDIQERGINFTSAFDDDSIRFYRTPVNGFEGVINPSLPTAASGMNTGKLSPTPISGSDIISIQYASKDIVQMSEDMSTASDAIKVDNSSGKLGVVNNNEILLVADCRDADIFLVGGASENAGIVTIDPQYNLTKPYAKDVDGMWPTVMRFVSNTYFVAPGTSGNALYRRDNINDKTVKLFDGIETMDVLYGVNTGAGTQYMDANTALALMDNVESVRVEFILRSLNKVEIVKASETVKEYIYRPFVATVKLRNRGVI